MSQWELSRKTGVHKSKISLAENDLIQIHPEEQKKIAEALGVSVKDLWASRHELTEELTEANDVAGWDASRLKTA